MLYVCVLLHAFIKKFARVLLIFKIIDRIVFLLFYSREPKAHVTFTSTLFNFWNFQKLLYLQNFNKSPKRTSKICYRRFLCMGITRKIEVFFIFILAQFVQCTLILGATKCGRKSSKMINDNNLIYFVFRSLSVYQSSSFLQLFIWSSHHFMIILFNHSIAFFSLHVASSFIWHSWNTECCQKLFSTDSVSTKDWPFSITYFFLMHLVNEERNLNKKKFPLFIGMKITIPFWSTAKM